MPIVVVELQEADQRGRVLFCEENWKQNLSFVS